MCSLHCIKIFQGMNVNRGWKVNLRLRPHYDDTQFLEYEDILGTLLHE